VNGRDHADQKIKADAVAFLECRRKRFAADARHAHLAVRLVSESVMEVVEELAVNAHRLHAVQHRVAGSLQHDILFNGELQSVIRESLTIADL
jgi:hypothetical protein